MERWGFLFSVMSSPIVYFLTTLLAVCPNINPTILCAHVCDVNYAACYSINYKQGKNWSRKTVSLRVLFLADQLFSVSLGLASNVLNLPHENDLICPRDSLLLSLQHYKI